MAGYNDRSDPNQINWEDYINYTPDDVAEHDAIDPGLRDPVDPAQVNASFPTYTNPPLSQPPTFQVQNTLSEPAFNPRFSQFSNFPTDHTQNQYLSTPIQNQCLPNPTQNQYPPPPENPVPVPGYSGATQGNPASSAGMYDPSTGFPDYNSGYTIPPSSNQVPAQIHPFNAPNYYDSTSAGSVLPAPTIQKFPTRGGSLAFPIPVNNGPPSTNTSPAATGSAFTGSSPAVYPNPNDVSSQTPGTTPGDSEPATTQGRKRQRETSPNTEQPRRTRRKTSNSSGSVVHNDSPADDSEPNATTSVFGRNRSRATTQPRNKANDSGTSTPASRKKPGKTSLGINVRRSRMKELSEPDQGNQLFSKATRTKKAKGKDKGEEANDETDSEKGRGGNKIIKVRRVCEFCANDPDGMAAFSVNGKCDWEQVASAGAEVFNRECGNCANYRSRNRQSGEMASKDDHKCKVKDNGALVEFNHKKYGDFDPYIYRKSTCDRCRKNNLEDVCDVDTVLGYGCSHCRRDEKCKVDGNLMPLRRPKKLKGRSWYRHACNRCQARHEKYKVLEENVSCNWLTDRSLWDQQRQACSVCYRDCAPCIDDKHNIIPPLPSAPPRQARAPTTWAIRKKFEVEEEKKQKNRKTPWHEYVEVATDTKWRKKCFGCQGAGRSVECLVMWDQANYACERCTQFGVDCVFHDVITNTWTRYPIYDLSRVGFGQFTPYVVCTPCKNNGLRCDRRRPCESCTVADTICDPIKPFNARGLIAREKIAPHKSRDPIPVPGPLYYLALGYGPDGINDIKDGQKIEHWIGPIAPFYGVEKLEDSGEIYRAVADLHQSHRPPEGVAPPTSSTLFYTSEGEQDKLEDVQSNALTVDNLASLIRQLWDNCKVPWSYEEAYRKLWGTLRRAQEDIMRNAGEDVQLPDAPAIPRAFRGNPLLADLEKIHNGFLGVSPQARPLPELPPGGHTVEPSQVDQISYTAPAPSPAVPYGGGYSDGVYSPASAQQGESIVALGGGVDHSQIDQAPDATPAPSLGIPADGGYPKNMYYSSFDEREENDITPGARDEQAGDNQQSQQTQPSDQSQPDVDLSGMTIKEMAKFFGLDEKKYCGRFMMGQYSPRTSKAGRRPIRKARPFANRVPRDTKVKDKTFNPFLNFALDENRKPRLKATERSSRWKVFNPLEGLDMEKWQNSNSQPDEDTSQPRLFSVVNGQRNQSVLRADILDDVPYEQIGGRSEQSCAEPGEGGIGRCGHQNANGQDQAVCQSSAHRDTAPGSFPVCNDCVQANVKDMFRHDCNPIIESELLCMRAYLCNDCAGHMSSSVKNAAEYRAIGARRVFGLEADKENSHSTYTPNNDRSQAVKFHKDTEALTGCSCANKLFGTSMCRFHRLYYAEEALKFSALVQEWRLSKFKKAVCPSCLAKKPLDNANLSADVGGFVNGAPTAWACVNCNDWVANEKNNKTNQPSLIDKKLWSSKDGRELFALRQESAHSRAPEIDDADMGGL